MSKQDNQEVVKALSKKIEDVITMDHKTGVGSAPEDIWEKSLPDTLSKDQIRQVKEHEANFVEAATTAFGNVAIQVMSKNPNLDNASLSIGTYGREKLELGMKRQATYHNPSDPSAEIVKYGVTSVSLKTEAGRNAGSLKKTLQGINEMAEKALKK